MKKKLGKGTRQALAIILATFMSISSIGMKSIQARAEEIGDTSANNYGLHNPRVEYNYRDTVIFGNYWQEDTNDDGVVDTSDDKQPITWQILEEYEDGTALVLADKILDSKSYTKNYKDCTWENSDIRLWLNGKSDGDFYKEAFNTSERSAIKEVQLVNDDNTSEGTEGGNNTSDNVFILSLNDMNKTAYGFNKNWHSYDQARIAKFTSFAMSHSANYGADCTGVCWVRSPGFTYNAAYINSKGFVDEYGYGVSSICGVRPALQINLSSSSIITGEKVKTSLKSSECDTVTFGSYNGYEISWRVLNVNGDDAFLLADRVIDEKSYNEEYASITWENSTIRTWLNGEFFNSAFDAYEQKMIKETNVINSDNSYYNIAGGENTTDKVYLLSLDEVVNSDYGFPNMYGPDIATRVAQNKDSSNVWWWLRSPGDYSNGPSSAYVSKYGDVDYSGFGGVNEVRGVRPALHIDLSYSAWEKGDTVKEGEAVPLKWSAFILKPEYESYTFDYADACYDDGKSVLMMVRVYPKLSNDYTYKFSDRTANMAWSACEERFTPDGIGTEIVFRGNTQFSDDLSKNAEFHMEIVKKNSESDKNYGYTDFPITFKDSRESGNKDQQVNDKSTDSEQGKQKTTETQDISNPTSKKEQTYKNAGAGVGKISTDGKILKDTNGKIWYMASKLKKNDIKKNLNVAVKNGGKYRITKVIRQKGKVIGGTLQYMAPYNKNCKKATTPKIVKINGITFNVTAISANAFKNCKKLTTFTVGENIITIGNNAFKGCISLNTVTIKTVKLKSIGTNAFKGTTAKTKFKVPKSMLSKYSKMIYKARANKKAKITK